MGTGLLVKLGQRKISGKKKKYYIFFWTTDTLLLELYLYVALSVLNVTAYFYDVCMYVMQLFYGMGV